MTFCVAVWVWTTPLIDNKRLKQKKTVLSDKRIQSSAITLINKSTMKMLSLMTLTLLLPVTRHNAEGAGHNTVQHSNSNISKQVRVNIVFTRLFLKEYLISYLIISRLIDSSDGGSYKIVVVCPSVCPSVNSAFFSEMAL